MECVRPCKTRAELRSGFQAGLARPLSEATAGTRPAAAHFQMRHLLVRASTAVTVCLPSVVLVVVTFTNCPFFRSDSLADFPSSVILTLVEIACECSFFPS